MDDLREFAHSATRTGAAIGYMIGFLIYMLLMDGGFSISGDFGAPLDLLFSLPIALPCMALGALIGTGFTVTATALKWLVEAATSTLNQPAEQQLEYPEPEEKLELALAISSTQRNRLTETERRPSPLLFSEHAQVHNKSRQTSNCSGQGVTQKSMPTRCSKRPSSSP